MKKLLLALLALLALALLAGIGAAVYRGAQLKPQPRGIANAALVEIDRADAADRLARALAYPTLAHADAGSLDAAAFRAHAEHLRLSFPRVHERLQLERVNQHSLLYTWAGSDPALPPVLLAGHLDVVPVEPGTESAWTQPPFGGRIADGHVWGRGALDDKGSVLAILEAAETLLALGHQPRRTLILAFGHDEEVGGRDGAQAIAQLLAQRGIRCAFTLDEGGAVTHGLVAGVTRPVATIMAGEKGYLSVRLRLSGAGGHSSTPPERSVIGRVARAVARLEAAPMPARLIPAVEAMLVGLAPEMGWPARIAIANRDWLAPLIPRLLAGSRTTNALIRTTTAPTLFRAGIRDNVLPSEAEAVVNFRLLPGDSIADVLRHVRETIDDQAIAVEPLAGFNNEAPPASDVSAPPFRLIERSVNEVFPEALVSSGLVLGATDSRHYAGVREQGYNFSPIPYSREDEGRIHGTDERIAVADYVRMVQFYAQLMRNTDAP